MLFYVRKEIKTYKDGEVMLIDGVTEMMEWRLCALAVLTPSYPPAPASPTTTLTPRQRVSLPRLCVPIRH